MSTNTLQILIYVVFSGIICACVYNFYARKFLGGFLRRLADGGFCSEENSVSLEKLGYSKVTSFFLNVSLGEGSSLRKYASAVYSDDEMKVCREKGISQLYYMTEDVSEIALERYNDKDMQLWKLVVCILLCIIAAGVSINLFPYAISAVKGIF